LITFDAWTLGAFDPYLAITAHYINAPQDHPLEWTLKSKVIEYPDIQGDHSGANTANVVMRIIDCYRICSKLG
jgi:hypothetical protein